MKKYQPSFINEVLQVFETEGINAAHERYHIPKNTIYRWKGKADMIHFLDGDKEKPPAEAPAAPGNQEAAPGRETAPESPAGTEPGEQPASAVEGPGGPACAPEAAEHIELAEPPDLLPQMRPVDRELPSPHRAFIGISVQGMEELTMLRQENERLRRENNQLRRAMQVMVELPEA